MLRLTLVSLIVCASSVACAQEAAPAEAEAGAEVASEAAEPEAPAAAAAEPAGPEIAAVTAPAVDAQHRDPSAPIYAEWWFWVGIGAIVIGVTLAIAIDVTTDDPAPRDVGAVMMTLRY
jgi:hypothetical protein